MMACTVFIKEFIFGISGVNEGVVGDGDFICR